ncbi:hypothetical protein [Hoeflea halophila]|uniref:hypothetical protein n=1 Tax=Hoeflea halophila TaxID=714899 RepID=UPI00117BD0AE|nr:hypothetical protein [Hoeflea halophila]
MRRQSGSRQGARNRLSGPLQQLQPLPHKSLPVPVLGGAFLALLILFEFRLSNDDPTPFAFSATVLAVLFAQLRGKLFIAPPIARVIIFSILPDPIVVLEPGGLVLEINPAAETLTGLFNHRHASGVILALLANASQAGAG